MSESRREQIVHEIDDQIESFRSDAAELGPSFAPLVKLKIARLQAEREWVLSHGGAGGSVAKTSA